MILLSSLIRRDLRLWAWCEGCGHHRSLDPAWLMARLGDRPVPRVGQALICSRCQGRLIDTRPDWPRSGVGAGHGPSQR